MKTPRFEELATRWAGKAQVFIVYSEEAHPRAAAFERLSGFAAELQSLDRDNDGAVTLAEYGSGRPRFMFDAFDLDHDERVHAHELLAARRIDQFRAVDEPTTYEARVELARRFRAEVPGSIRVLVDPIDNRTAKAYGGLPNSAYVIDRDGRVAAKFAWASVVEVERELARMTGAPPPAVADPDLTVIASSLEAARASRKPVLLELVSPGCDACRKMDATTLADADVKTALGGFELVRLGVEHDAAWRLFEQLDLAATPAFVVIGPDGTIGRRRQGFHDKAPFLAFLTER